MTGFSEYQTAHLGAKLRAKHVRRREKNGTTLHYVEGWHAIAEANRIFGFDGWDRETLDLRCVSEIKGQGRCACAYMARVRIRVRAGEALVVREGAGMGQGRGPTPGEAHENALKEAETDATKRALVTFGNPFGLALYDKTRAGVWGRLDTKGRGETLSLELDDGSERQTFRKPTQFCGALRRRLETCAKLTALEDLWARNRETVSILKEGWPELNSRNDQHYADILTALYETRRKALANGADTSAPSPAQVDVLEKPNRTRDRDHLRFVAAQPCLVCRAYPTQAHHIRYAQPKALGKKVGDEWTVPLCHMHHRALHDAGDEPAWWVERQTDPLLAAMRLWKEGKDSAL